MGAPDLERAWPRGRPRMVPGLGEGASVDKLEPLLPGGQRKTPPPPLPHAASTLFAWPPELHKPARPAAPLYAPPLKRVPRGRSLKPCVAFSFTFLHLEERTVFDSALFMFLLGNKRWLCACVFFCVGFFFF